LNGGFYIEGYLSYALPGSGEAGYPLAQEEDSATAAPINVFGLVLSVCSRARAIFLRSLSVRGLGRRPEISVVHRTRERMSAMGLVVFKTPDGKGVEC